MYRQGDVLLAPVDPAQLPERLTWVARDGYPRLVQRRGCTTGRAHVVTATTAQLLVDRNASWPHPQYLRLAAAAQLTHEQHAPILLPPGTYRVVLQREYNPRVSKCTCGLHADRLLALMGHPSSKGPPGFWDQARPQEAVRDVAG